MAQLIPLQKDLRVNGNSEKAIFLQRFFKTKPGGYAEGDQFLGLTVPTTRQLVKSHRDLNLSDLKILIKSVYHEERLAALFILIYQYQRLVKTGNSQIIYDFVCKHMRFINNWDLVDTIAPHVIGRHLYDKNRQLLQTWAEDKNLWTRRTAIVATHHFIRQHHFEDTLIIAKKLLGDSEDLIHKATGWMLREVGKCDRAVEEKFLMKHYHKMPRTMLRYAIEHFPEKRRKDYLLGNI